MESAVAEWKAAGGRIPDDLGSSLGAIPEIQPIYAQSLQKQVGIEDTYQQGLGPLSVTYIHGLEIQIERLKADKDTGAIALIEAEIAKTKNSTKYFSDLMLGIEPKDE